MPGHSDSSEKSKLFKMYKLPILVIFAGISASVSNIAETIPPCPSGGNISLAQYF